MLRVIDKVLLYVEQTEILISPDETALFVTHVKPHKKPAKYTIRRWILEMLNRTGVDTSIYTSHSTRHASSSNAVSCGALSNIVLSKGGWFSYSVLRKHNLSIKAAIVPITHVNSISANFHDYI